MLLSMSPCTEPVTGENLKVQNLLQELLDFETVPFDLALRIANLALSGVLTDAQLGSFLFGLKQRGETGDVIGAFASAMRSRARAIHGLSPNVIDICGTGGDGKGYFNVSTTSMFVVAAAGGYVAKHGSGAISSSSGSADVLRALGVNLDMPTSAIVSSVNTLGVGFFLSSRYNDSWLSVGKVRTELGFKSVFNAVGPLINPANPGRQLIGVYDKSLLRPIVEAARRTGSKHILAVHSETGSDEIAIDGDTFYCELKDGVIYEGVFHVEDILGTQRTSPASVNALVVRDEFESRDILIEVLSGIKGPAFDFVSLNAGAAIYISGLAPDVKSGVTLARACLQNGAAEEVLKKFLEIN